MPNDSASFPMLMKPPAKRRQRVTLPEGQVVHGHLVACEDSVAHELPLAGLARCREAGKLVVGDGINLHVQGCVMRH